MSARVVIACHCLLLAMMAAFAAQAEEVDLKAMILMPGPVIAAHAEEERNCEACHADFDKSAQASLCTACHEDVAADRKQHQGFHGIDPKTAASACRNCHKEHRGRDFDSIGLDSDIFDHTSTDFELLGKHALAPCDSCHQGGEAFREADTTCNACHTEQDSHRRSLGDDCAACHDPGGWHLVSKFDHDQTSFPLRDAHLEAGCGSCHAGETFSFQSTECLACHRVQDVHLGRFGGECDSCHSQSEWLVTEFDHTRETSFALTGVHKEQSCQACHHDSSVAEAPAEQCVGCHSNVDVHSGGYGNSCDDCHGTGSWAKASFDHGNATGWPLEAGHAQLTCLQCHSASPKEVTGAGCRSCHSQDDVHRSPRLEDCSLCHDATAWERSQGFDHELTLFPLEGMHAIAQCKACHTGFRFDKTETVCTTCHVDEDAHEGGMGQRCEACHSPNGWSLWIFDHERNTGFDLSEGHQNVACAACHQGDSAADVNGTCGSCHVVDDHHEGGFGKNCGRCHSGDNWRDVKWAN